MSASVYLQLNRQQSAVPLCHVSTASLPQLHTSLPGDPPRIPDSPRSGGDTRPANHDQQKRCHHAANLSAFSQYERPARHLS
eukprot:366367-Chlamydomonas_euryale.AAC.9